MDTNPSTSDTQGRRIAASIDAALINGHGALMRCAGPSPAAASIDAALINGHTWVEFRQKANDAASIDAALINGHVYLELAPDGAAIAASIDAALINGHVRSPLRSLAISSRVDRRGLDQWTLQFLEGRITLETGRVDRRGLDQWTQPLPALVRSTGRRVDRRGLDQWTPRAPTGRGSGRLPRRSTRP